MLDQKNPHFNSPSNSTHLQVPTPWTVNLNQPTTMSSYISSNQHTTMSSNISSNQHTTMSSNISSNIYSSRSISSYSSSLISEFPSSNNNSPHLSPSMIPTAPQEQQSRFDRLTRLVTRSNRRSPLSLPSLRIPNILKRKKRK